MPDIVLIQFIIIDIDIVFRLFILYFDIHFVIIDVDTISHLFILYVNNIHFIIDTV